MNLASELSKMSDPKTRAQLIEEAQTACDVTSKELVDALERWHKARLRARALAWTAREETSP